MTQQTNIDASPQKLDHVIGQKRVVKQLKVALDAHFNDRILTNDKQALGHILLTGPPGTGKSLLSSIITSELGSTCHVELGQNIQSPMQMQGLLMLLDPEDVLFIDEIHELPSQIQTTLLKALEERVIILASIGNRKSQTIKLPPFNLIGATTEEYQMVKPLRDRMRFNLRLTHYTSDEIAQLLKQRALRLNWTIDDEVFSKIAQRSRGTPRLAIRLLESCRRTSRSHNTNVITNEHFEMTCQIQGIDSLGLDLELEQQYLQILYKARDAVRLNILTMNIGIARKTIESVVEPELIRLGLITKTEQGRILTDQGRKHLESNKENLYE